MRKKLETMKAGLSLFSLVCYPQTSQDNKTYKPSAVIFFFFSFRLSLNCLLIVFVRITMISGYGYRVTLKSGGVRDV